MADDSNQLHEAAADLSDLTRDFHRAIVSLQEELEAVDWYRQRAESCSDEDLRAVLEHNMREEIEHAAMILEWLRRRDQHFDDHLRTYLWTRVPITEAEKAATNGGHDKTEPASDSGPVRTTVPETLTLGSLKGH